MGTKRQRWVPIKSVLSERFEMKVTPDMKRWMFAYGGAAYLRRFVDEDRQRQEQEGSMGRE